MFYYSYQELYKLIKAYNKNHNTKIDINEVLNPNINKVTYNIDQPTHDFNKYPPVVIFEDEDYYGISKPPYWIVNVGSVDKSLFDVHKNMNRNLLQVWLYKNLNYPLRNSINEGYGICNRLDINTSGIVIVAKHKESYYYLRKIINEHRKISKKYFALVKGRIENYGFIETSINCIFDRKSTQCYNNEFGKYAKTKFTPIAYLVDKEGADYTLLDIKIYTGRTHQIRVHMKMLNTYIIGDPLYSGKSKDLFKEMQLVPRIFLHAYSYKFIKKNNNKIKIISPLYFDLLDAIKENFDVKDDLINKEELIEILSNPQ